MFIQIIQGRCIRRDDLRRLHERWRQNLAPGADGWLGATLGFTEDDQFVDVVRFESQDAARANAARPEQGAWAQELLALVDGPLEFHDCTDVTLLMGGGSDDAGFVQVIRGRVEDPARLRAMVADAVDRLHEARPEIIGGTLAIEADGTFTETVAFTDEASARKGEQKDMPEDVRKTLEEAVSDVRYLDLQDLWMASPGKA
ncbi:MAG: hypothetical protein WB441_10120 [Nocardioidaceae bacterium]